jgi:predicted Holliday junction resolvase-like endonuclease
MNPSKQAKEVIKTLETRGFYAECPCCDSPIPLRSAGLFYLDQFTSEAQELYNERRKELRGRGDQLKERRKSISQTSEVGAKAVNIGSILERLAPSMSSFRFERNDCRSLFDPIDYLIFEGLSKRGSVSKILFVDIKTGGARLKSVQRQIRSLVDEKHVEWDTYKAEASK